MHFYFFNNKVNNTKFSYLLFNFDYIFNDGINFYDILFFNNFFTIIYDFFVPINNILFVFFVNIF